MSPWDKLETQLFKVPHLQYYGWIWLVYWWRTIDSIPCKHFSNFSAGQYFNLQPTSWRWCHISGSYIRRTAKAHLDVNLCGWNISANIAWGTLANHYRSFSGGRSKMMIFINQDGSKTPHNTTSDPCLTRIWNGCLMPCRMPTISSILLPHLQSLSVRFAFHQNNMPLSSFVYGCLWFPWGPECLGLVHSNRAEVSPYFWLLGERTVLRPLVGWSVCIDRLKLFKEGSDYDQIMIRLIRWVRDSIYVCVVPAAQYFFHTSRVKTFHRKWYQIHPNSWNCFTTQKRSQDTAGYSTEF